MTFSFSKIIIIISFFFSLPSIAQEKIEVGYGPEDLVYDSENDQIIAVCDNRRDAKESGEFWRIDPATLETTKLKVKLPSIPFHPIGMDIITVNKEVYLLVSSVTKERKNAVIRFRVKGDSVIAERVFQKGFIGHPNDVFAIDINHFYYSSSQVFGGEVVYYNGESFEKIIKHQKMPNGVEQIDSLLYVSTTISNKLVSYKKVNEKWKKQQNLTKIKGADNLSFFGGYLYCTSHPKFGKLAKHAKHPKSPSPTIIYKIDLKGNKTTVYEEDGSFYSAASSVVVVGQRLFAGQIFDNKVLVLDVK